MYRCERGGFAQAAQLFVRTGVHAEPLGGFDVEGDIIDREALCATDNCGWSLLSLLGPPGFWLPTVRTERHVYGKHANDGVVLKYVALTSCQSCHLRLC